MSQTPQAQLCHSCRNWTVQNGGGFCILSQNGCECFAMGHTSENCKQFHVEFLQGVTTRLSNWTPQAVCHTCNGTYLSGEDHQCVCTACRAHAENNNDECRFAVVGCFCRGYGHTEGNCIQGHTEDYAKRQLAAVSTPPVARLGSPIPGQDRRSMEVDDRKTAASKSESVTAKPGSLVSGQSQRQINTTSDTAASKSKTATEADHGCCAWCLEDLKVKAKHKKKGCPCRGDKCEECGVWSRGQHLNCPQGNCGRCWESKQELHKLADCPVLQKDKKNQKSQENQENQENKKNKKNKKGKKPTSAQQSGATQTTSETSPPASSVKKPSTFSK